MEKTIKICSNDNFVSRGQAKRHLLQMENEGYNKVIFDCSEAGENNQSYINYLKDEIEHHYLELDFEIIEITSFRIIHTFYNKIKY